MQLHLISYLDMGINYRFQDRVGSYTNLEGETKNYSPYGITDVRLSWNHPRYTLYIEGNNLFDKTYVDYGLVPQPGRWFTAGLRVVIN